MFFSSTRFWTRFQGIGSRTVKRSLLGIGGALLVVVGLYAALQIPRSFAPDELALVTGQGAPTGETFYGTVYNGSKSKVVREITIHVTFHRSSPKTTALPPGIPAPPPGFVLDDPPKDERDYQVRDLWVPPLGTGSFSVGIVSLPGLEFDQWQIVAAHGVRNWWPL